MTLEEHSTAGHGAPRTLRGHPWRTRLQLGLAFAAGAALSAGAVYGFGGGSAPATPPAPAARAALERRVDLLQIAAVRYVRDDELELTDERGRTLRMQLTARCPGLRGARTISLVTEGVDDLDRFTGIAVDGHVCTLSAVAPRILP